VRRGGYPALAWLAGAWARGRRCMVVHVEAVGEDVLVYVDWVRGYGNSAMRNRLWIWGQVGRWMGDGRWGWVGYCLLCAVNAEAKLDWLTGGKGVCCGLALWIETS